VSLLGENKIAAEGKTTAPEDFTFTAWRLPHSLPLWFVPWLFSRPQHFEA
jgi:hypothetical protein